MSRRTRFLVVATTTALSTLALTGLASAHVTVHSEEATQGGYAKLTFRVPTEEKDNTVTVAVTLPKATPIASVAIKPKQGWTATTTMTHLAVPLTSDDGQVADVVGQITWTAAKGGGIPVGGFDEFDVSVGPLPKVASMGFPTLQTYADGTVVSWTEPTPRGGTVPDHPVPALDLAPAARAGHSTSMSATSASQSPAGPAGAAGPTGVTVAAAVPAADTSALATRSEADTGKTLGVVGIVVGTLGLLLGGAGLARDRRRSAG
jgi:uncharacterized protein YcnI